MSEPRSPRWRLAVALVVVAVGAAGFAIAFRASLEWVATALGGSDIVSMIEGLPLWQRIALPVAGGLAAGLIALAAARVRQGAGVGYVMEAIVLGNTRVPILRSLLNALGSWLAIAGGNSLGREGPLIQIGAASGEAARRGLRLDDATARIVLAAGVAAGFAAAYNAPIAAVLFVVEVVTGVAVLEAVVPVAITTVLATVFTRLALGEAPLYGIRDFTAISMWELVAFAGVGLVAALLGVAFLRLLSFVERGFRRLPMPARPAIGGLLCGGMICALPLLAGNGFEPVAMLLDGKLAVAVVLWLLIAKPLATAMAVSSGQPGGVFTPTLLIGACAGTLCALGLYELFGDAIAAPGAYALVGLAAALAATTHAPLTATVLACELSGDWAMVLPLLLASAIAAGAARKLYIDSVYTAELTRRGLRWRLTLDGRRIIADQRQAVDVV
ncbi:MAG: chloride channel protein [Deltaproteobacteria bacterium]|nr:chloride channel protein [Deltaproteobacteria bacterium]